MALAIRRGGCPREEHSEGIWKRSSLEWAAWGTLLFVGLGETERVC